MERQFTATAYIIDRSWQKTLLILHPKLLKWLPPGGHIEPNETPPEAAKREALEETGLEIELISQENVWINRWNATSFERPYLCLLEEIPEHNGKVAHQHMDFIYLSHPKREKTSSLENKENITIRWFTLVEIEKLSSDIDIFEETKITLRSLMRGSCVESIL